MNSEKDRASLDKTLSRNTKLFVLLAVVLIGVAYTINDTEIALVVGSLVALFAVMLVDYFQILSRHHPNTWRAIKYLIIAVVILLTLIGFSGT